MPFQEQFAGFAEVDYSLVSGPTFGSNYLTLNAKGEFYYLPHKTVLVLDFLPPTMNQPTPNPTGVTIYSSAYA